MSEDVRLVAWVRGQVQGVGFRWFTRARALELGGMSGFALNLGDGRVQVVAEGPRERCEGLLEWLRGDDTPGRVDGVTEIWDTPRGGTRASPSADDAPCEGPRAPGATLLAGAAGMKTGRWLPRAAARGRLRTRNDRHAPRGPQESQRRRSPAACPRAPANTGRDRVDRQTFW